MFRIPLSKEESELILEYRLKIIKSQLTGYLYNLDIKQEAWDILFNMTYQLGARGFVNFKKMIKALEKQDLFINSTLAQMGSSLFWGLFRNGLTENRGFFLNLKNFQSQPIKL